MLLNYFEIFNYTFKKVVSVDLVSITSMEEKTLLSYKYLQKLWHKSQNLTQNQWLYSFSRYNCADSPKILTYSYSDRLFTKFITKETPWILLQRNRWLLMWALLYRSHSFLCVSIEAIWNFKALWQPLSLMMKHKTRLSSLVMILVDFTSFVGKITKK